MGQVRELFGNDSLGDLLQKLGGISPKRIRLNPPPGRATENDVVRIQEKEGRLYELIDGTLVEKIMGFPESHLASRIVRLLAESGEDGGYGVAAGADAMLRLMPHQIRIPDAAFISWVQIPSRRIPLVPIGNFHPDLAVEVVSAGNTKKEMQRKLREYFDAGASIVWLVYPLSRSVSVYNSPTSCVEYFEGDTLDGGTLIPGMALPVTRIFELLERPAGPAKSPNGGKKQGRKS